MTSRTTWLCGLIACSALALRCGSSEDGPAGMGGGAGASAGSAGSAGAGGAGAGGSGAAGSGAGGSGGGAGAGTGGSADAGDAAADVALDAPSDAEDASADVADDTGDAGADVAEAGAGGRLLLVSRASYELVFGESSGAGWTTTAVTYPTLSLPGIVAAPWGALAVARKWNDGGLVHSIWDPASSSWSPFSIVSPTGATFATPALAAPSFAHLVFVGVDSKLYSNEYVPGTGFSTGFTNVEAGGVHSWAVSAPALAVSGSGVTAAFEGVDHDLYTQAWQGGWQSAVDHELIVPVKAFISPAAVARAGTNEIVVAWTEEGTFRLMWMQGAGSTWTQPSPVHPLALTYSSPALAALPSGDVAVAYRGVDDKVYATVIQGASAAPPALVHSSLGTTASPALAAGVGGHVAELAWVSSGTVLHSSLGASGWSTPVTVFPQAQLSVALARYAP